MGGAGGQGVLRSGVTLGGSMVGGSPHPSQAAGVMGGRSLAAQSIGQRQADFDDSINQRSGLAGPQAMGIGAYQVQGTGGAALAGSLQQYGDAQAIQGVADGEMQDDEDAFWY